MTKKEFQNKYSPKYDKITINGVTISYDCYEIDVEDGKDVVCFYNEGGYCFMCSIPLEDVDLINRQQTEIERLQGKNLMLSQKRITFPERIELVNNARAEAIKEFAERLKNRLKGNGGLFCVTTMNAQIDNLVKEMVGEQE